MAAAVAGRGFFFFCCCCFGQNRCKPCSGAAEAEKYAVTGWNRYAWSSTPAFSPSPSFADQRSSAIESRRSGENEEMEKEGKFAGSSGYENMNGGLAKES